MAKAKTPTPEAKLFVTFYGSENEIADNEVQFTSQSLEEITKSVQTDLFDGNMTGPCTIYACFPIRRLTLPEIVVEDL